MTESYQINHRRALLALVILAELVFLTYFFSLDLPNSGTPEGRVSRWLVWQVAIGCTDLPTPALDALRQIVNGPALAQRLPTAAFALLIVAAAIILGRLLLSWLGMVSWPTGRSNLESKVLSQDASQAQGFQRVEQLVLAYGLGISFLSLATLAIGLAGVMHRGPVVAALVATVIGGSVPAARRFRRSRDKAEAERSGSGLSKPGGHPSRRSAVQVFAVACAAVVVALFLSISFLGAMLPATDFDVREYHLQGPKEIYLAGHIEFLPHNVYANMPFGSEMLSLLGMIVAGDWWWGALVGQTVLASFAPMTALGVWALARRLFCKEAGWPAALIYLTTPWIYRISIIPYTENALCFYLLAGTLSAVCAFRASDRWVAVKIWAITGAMAGSAAACKYPALISTVLSLGLAAMFLPFVRRVSLSPFFPLVSVLAFAAGVALMFGPWLAKNWIQSGNPTYPLLYNVFGGHNWTPEKNAKWEWGHRVSLLVALGVQRPPQGKSINAHDPQHALTLRRLAENVLDVTAQADWQSPLVFGLAPFALLGRRRREAAWLWGFVVFLFFQWWLLTHRLDRFWVPLIPVAAVLAGAGATWTSDAFWRRFVVGVVIACVFYNFSFEATGLCGNNNYGARLDPTDRDPTDDMVNVMNQVLPESARVLAVAAADLFHLNRPVLYNTVFDDSIFEQLVRDREPDEAAAALRQRGVTHLYVNWMEVARYREPWSYGFTDFVTPQLFDQLVAARVLRRLPIPPGLVGRSVTIGSAQAAGRELYEVVLSDSSAKGPSR